MLSEEYKKILREIIFRYLNPNKDKVFIFGSRATGTNREFSDIDIGIKPSAALSSSVLSRIKEDLEESDLPYTIDLVDFSGKADRFREVASQKTINLN